MDIYDAPTCHRLLDERRDALMAAARTGQMPVAAARDQVTQLRLTDTNGTIWQIHPDTGAVSVDPATPRNPNGPQRRVIEDPSHHHSLIASLEARAEDARRLQAEAAAPAAEPKRRSTLKIAGLVVLTVITLAGVAATRGAPTATTTTTTTTVEVDTAPVRSTTQVAEALTNTRRSPKVALVADGASTVDGVGQIARPRWYHLPVYLKGAAATALGTPVGGGRITITGTPTWTRVTGGPWQAKANTFTKGATTLVWPTGTNPAGTKNVAPLTAFTFDAAVALGPAVARVDAGDTEARGGRDTARYTITIDPTRAGAAYTAWFTQLGETAPDTLDVWIDSAGAVAVIEATTDTTTWTWTYAEPAASETVAQVPAGPGEELTVDLSDVADSAAQLPESSAVGPQLKNP